MYIYLVLVYWDGMIGCRRGYIFEAARSYDFEGVMFDVLQDVQRYSRNICEFYFVFFCL